MSKTHKLTVGYPGHEQSLKVDVPATEPRPWDLETKTRYVGKKIPRVDGHLKVSGAARYTFDVNPDQLLHAAVLRSPFPSAKLTKLDLRKAKKMPGVKAVFAVAKVGDRMLFAGQDVAAVAAERPEQARDALAVIETDYEVMPHVTNLRAAMSDRAPVVHQKAVKARRTEGDEPGTHGAAETDGNVRHGQSMRKGDVRKGLRQAELTFEATYETQVHTHCAMEPHGITVRWDDRKKMTVWASTQSIFSVRGEMAEMFGLQPDDVQVITEFMGGGFGAKFGANAPGSAIGKMAGELAREAGRPVRLVLTREEEQLCTGNRPSSLQEVKLGARRDGRLTAIHVKAHGTAGIGTGAGVGRNAFAIYSQCPNILVESADVFTHAGPGAAFRAPGHPQGAFAIESALDELAREAGVDPLELRRSHDQHPVRKKQLDIAATAIGWTDLRAEAKKLRDAKARVRRGVGLAASIWGDFGRSGVVVTCSVDPRGRITIKNGVQDIGGGIGTVMAQVAAEVFVQPVEAIVLEIGRSEYGPSTGSGGSKTTSYVTAAVRNACEEVKRQLGELAATKLGTKADKLTWSPEGVRAGAKGQLSFAEVAKLIDADAIVATGTRAETFTGWPMKFMGQDFSQIAGVQAAEVEVDTWTGEVRCRRVVAVHDCGRVMNELTLRSQINGGVILGTAYALMEQRVMDDALGVVLNPNLETYKPLGAQDLPEIDVHLTEVFTPNNSTGAIGIGEPSTIPTAAAIANAVGDALGVHVRSLPITPSRVFEALGRLG